MAFSGDLNSFGLADVFQTLTQNQQTGTLRIHDDETEKYIFFNQGTIRSVSSGKRRNIPLGELLVASGKITEQQLVAALQAQEDRQDEMLLGQTLVEMGICQQEDIDAVLRFQMEEEIYGLFTWKDAEFEFSEGSMQTAIFGRRHRISEVSINTGGLVMEAARRIDEWSRISEAVPSLSMVFLPGPDLAGGTMPEDASEQELRILEQVDGVNTVSAIARKTLLGQYLVTQCLARYSQAGWLREANAEELRAAGEKAVLAGEPDVAADIYTRLIELGEDTPAVRRLLASALEGGGRLDEAARHLRRLGETLSDQGDFAEAINAFEHAGRLTTLSGDDMDRLAELYMASGRQKEAADMWLTRVRTLLDRKDLPRARQLCERALEYVPESEDLHAIHGRVLMQEGDHKGAVAAYENLAGIYESRGNAQAAIATYRNIIHLDASRVDLRDRIKTMQKRLSRRKEEARYRFAIYATLTVIVLLLLLVAGLDLLSRRRLAQAETLSARKLEEARGLEDPQRRIARLEEIRRMWADYEPGFSVSDLTPRVEARLAQVEEAIEKATAAARTAAARVSAEARERLETARRLLASGEPERRSEALVMLRRLAGRQPATEWSRRAAELLEEATAASDAAAALAAQSRQPGKTFEERFELIRTLVENYPKTAFAHQARLPVKVSVDPLLTARVLLGEETVGTLGPDRPELEVGLPPFEAFTLRVVRPGFGHRGVTEWAGKGYRRPTLEISLAREIRWQDTETLAGPVAAAPAVLPPVRRGGDRVLAVAGTDGRVAAFNLETGRLLWRFDGEPRRFSFRAPPTLVEENLYLVDTGGRLVCLDPATGALRWPEPGQETGLTVQLTGEAFFAQLSFFQDRLFCLAGTQDGRVACLDASNGRSVWNPLYDTGVRRPLASRGAAWKDFLYFADPAGTLHVLRGDGKAAGTVALGAGVRAPLVVEDGVLYVATTTGAVSAWQTGQAPEERWRLDRGLGPVRAAPLVLEQQLLLGCENRRAVALARRAPREPLWQQLDLPAAVRAPMAVTRQRLLVPAGRTLLSLDLQRRGRERWRHTPSESALTGVAATADRLAAVDEAGGVYVFDVDRDPE